MDIDAAALAMFEKFVALPKDVSEPLISKLLAIRCCSGSFVGTNVMDSLFPSVEGGGSQLP
jgi:hypothetical protein